MEGKSTKTKILDKASELFLQFGFSKVSMDELASGLAMSKKTIYKYFPGKKALIWMVINSIKIDVQKNVIKIANDESLPYEERLKKIMNFVGLKLSKVQKPLIIDMQKNYPQLWEEISNFRKELLSKHLKGIIEKGIESGSFRNDINQEIFMMMYINTIQTIVTPEVLAELPFTATEVFQMIIRVFFRGILTEEAQKTVFSGGEK